MKRGVVHHAAICACGWQTRMWPGPVGDWLVGVLFHRHLKRCTALPAACPKCMWPNPSRRHLDRCEATS